MKSMLNAILLAGFLLLGTHTAHAACISMATVGGALPSNDVSLDGFAFEVASVPLNAFEVDMNGVQPGLRDERLWATHGTLVVLVQPTGELEIMTSWSQNTSVDGVEWVCRLKPDPGAPVWIGDGNFHSPLFGSGNVIDRCVLDLVADC